MRQPPDDWLTTTQAAEIIGVSERRVRQLCQAGRLVSQQPGGQVWLILRSDVDAYIARLSDGHR